MIGKNNRAYAYCIDKWYFFGYAKDNIDVLPATKFQLTWDEINVNIPLKNDQQYNWGDIIIAKAVAESKRTIKRLLYEGV